MDKLQEIISKCKCEVIVKVNEHKIYYESVEEKLDDLIALGLEVDPKLREEIVKRDMLVDVQVYPHTPIGFYKCIHYNLEAALDEILSCLEQEEDQ